MTMSEPIASASAITLTTTGLTIFGVATGLRPELLLAGVTGALWALSYGEPLPPARRITITVITALVAGYLTPAVVALLRLKAILPTEIDLGMVQPPAAVMIGFLAYRVIGPAVVRLADKAMQGKAP